MKAISYCRVSTDIQDFDRQIEDIRNYCIDTKLNLIKEFAEKESGKIKVRAVLTEMLDYLKSNNEIDYLVISELSRLGRTSKVLETLEFLNEKKIGLISIKERITTLNADKSVNYSSSLILSILSSINNYELETIKYRSKSGIHKSMLDGNANGSNNLPYGYKKENKLLVVDKKESEVIKTIFNLYLEGRGTKLIANYLNENKIPTRNQIIIAEGKNKKEIKYRLKWVDGTIYSILINPIYKGERRYKDKLLNYNKNIQIIETDIFNNTQTLLKSNYNKIGINRKFNYLFDNKKIVCGVCGRSYFPHKRSNNNDNRYICLSTRYNENCGNNGISIDKLENLVQSVILYKLDDILEIKLENEKIKEQISDSNTKIEILNKELNIEKRNEGNLIDMSLENEISKDIFSTKHKSIKLKQDLILNKIRMLEENLRELNNIYKNIKDIELLKIKFNKENIKLEKNIVNTIVSKIIINKIENENENVNILVNKIKEFGYYKNKQDRFIIVNITSGQKKLKFLISQREKYVYDFEEISIMYSFDKVGFNKVKIHLPLGNFDYH